MPELSPRFSAGATRTFPAPEAAEAKLAEALDLAEKIELQRQAAESREKALREALDFFWDAVAAEDIERAQAGCDCASDACHHQVTVAFDRARAALAAGKEMDHGHVR